MGFEPHSVAGPAMKPASRLLLRGPAPSQAPRERGSPLSESPVVGIKSHRRSVSSLERAMGFEPTTTCLGSKDSTTELRPLAESNPTLAFSTKSRNANYRTRSTMANFRRPTLSRYCLPAVMASTVLASLCFCPSTSTPP